MIFVLIFVGAVLIFLGIYFRLFLYFIPEHRLIILMYHQIKPQSDDALTVTVENFENQLRFLRRNNYNCLFFKDLTSKKILLKKSIILTFDDGYLNNKEYLLPLLKKYNLKAAIFIPTSFIEHGYAHHKLMTYDDLRNLDESLIEIGLHSDAHRNFREMTADEVLSDLKTNMQKLDNQKIKCSKVLAYPYGKYPKDSKAKAELFNVLEKLQIEFAVRIGNKVNYFPTAKRYELCRIDIRSDDDLERFKKKLIFGKLKLF